MAGDNKHTSFGDLRNTAGTKIDPATEGKQTESIAVLKQILGFDIPVYDNIALTYVAAGNGVGEIETVLYKDDTTTVATLTLTYNADNKIATVTLT